MSTKKIFQYILPYSLYVLIISGAYFLSLVTTENFSFHIFITTVSILFLCAYFLSRYFYDFIKDEKKIFFLFVLSSGFFLFEKPFLSSDIHRYIWEGHIQNFGHNPYSTAPDNAIFSNETLNNEVNHPHMAAIYPPLAQITFRILSFIAPSVFFFKLIFSFISFAFIYFLSRKKEYFDKAYLLGALFPFLLIETASSGHLDILGIFSFTAAVYFLLQKRGLFAGLFLGFSVMIKIIPILFFPLFFLNLTKKEKYFFAATFLACFLFYIPYLDAGYGLFASLSKYSKEWVFSGFFYTILKTTGLEAYAIRVILAGFFLTVYGILLLKIKNIFENIFLTWLSLCLLSPVVYPWYFLWLIPFAKNKYFYATAFFLLASFFTYEVLDEWFYRGIWEENNLLVTIAYFAAIALFMKNRAFLNSMLKKRIKQ